MPDPSFGTTSPYQTVMPETDAVRLARMTRARKYYKGDVPNTLVPIPNQPDDNIRVGARRITATHVSWLFGKPVEIEIDEIKETPAEDWQETALTPERLTVLCQMVAMNASQTGEGVWKILMADPENGFEYPRLVVIQPEQFSVTLDPHDKDIPLDMAVTYPDTPVGGKPRLFRQLWQPLGSGWQSFDQHSIDDGKIWTNDPDGVGDWPFPFPPFIWCQNLPNPWDFWGTPDLSEDVLDTIDQRNRQLSNLNRLGRMFGSPQIVGEGVDPNQVKGQNDRAIGDIIAVPGNGKFTVLQPDLPKDLPLLDRLERTLSELTDVPSISVDNMPSLGQLSGVAMQVLYAPTIARTLTKRDLFGPWLSESMRRFLIVGGWDIKTTPKVHWPELIPTDPLVERQLLQLEIAMGITSKQTATELIGRDWEVEQARLVEEAATAAKSASMAPQFDANGQPVVDENGKQMMAAKPTPGVGTDAVKAVLGKIGAAGRNATTPSDASGKPDVGPSASAGTATASKAKAPAAKGAR